MCKIIKELQKNRPNELVDILILYRGWIIGCTLISFLLGATYMFLNPVYESRALVRIGKIHKETYIEDPNIAARRLQSKPVTLTQDGAEALRFSVVVDKTPGFIILKMQSSTAQSAQNLLIQEVDNLVGHHKELWQQAMELRKQKKNVFLQTINESEKIIDGLERQVSQEREHSMIAWISFEKSNLLKLQAESRKYLVEIEENEVVLAPTVVISPPTLPATPTRSPVASSVVYLFGGLTFGILASLGHFYAKRILAAHRERESV